MNDTYSCFYCRTEFGDKVMLNAHVIAVHHVVFVVTPVIEYARRASDKETAAYIASTYATFEGVVQ